MPKTLLFVLRARSSLTVSNDDVDADDLKYFCLVLTFINNDPCDHIGQFGGGGHKSVSVKAELFYIDSSRDYRLRSF